MWKCGDEMDKKIYNEIKRLQSKLNRNIEKNGLQNSETINISNSMDQLINYYYFLAKRRQYPLNSNMMLFYEAAYEELKQMTIKNNKFPEVKEWNKYAKQNDLLSSESLKYISMFDWNYLKIKISRELNKNFYKKIM